ncbi:MAG TPA: hypothetical protein VFF82_02155 [Rhodocyclaceae bacterium]|nr:hypothetical protein [Rhodocyclaceae bacterium]
MKAKSIIVATLLSICVATMTIAADKTGTPEAQGASGQKAKVKKSAKKTTQKSKQKNVQGMSIMPSRQGTSGMSGMSGMEGRN